MILQGKLTGDGSLVAVHIEGERVTRIELVRKGDPDLYLSPGFFDPHVNGFAGVDFNDKNLLPEDVHRAAEAICATGVTAFFPALISASSKRLLRQLRILREAIETDAFVSGACGGIHLEGPYLSSSKGPRGVHSLRFVRPPRWDEFERFQEACGGRIKLVTLAPEKDGALDFIEKATANGIVAAIGHTAAPDEILEAACTAGARLSTHLGNGLGNRFPRYRNPFHKQLAMDRLMASIIADGNHLPDYVVKTIVRSKGAKNIILITDAVSGAAQPPGRYGLGDLEVETHDDGRACLTGTASLAGTTLSMPRAISNVIRFTGVDLHTAVGMATENGTKLFPGLTGTIAPGQLANLVLFRFKDEIAVERVFLRGRKFRPVQYTIPA